MQTMAIIASALAFPSTITTMALQAGVLGDADDEIFEFEDPLTDVTIHYVLKRALAPPRVPCEPEGNLEVEAQPPPPSALEPTPATTAPAPVPPH